VRETGQVDQERRRHPDRFTDMKCEPKVGDERSRDRMPEKKRVGTKSLINLVVRVSCDGDATNVLIKGIQPTQDESILTYLPTYLVIVCYRVQLFGQ
jgi:hypothetical protein